MFWEKNKRQFTGIQNGGSDAPCRVVLRFSEVARIAPWLYGKCAMVMRLQGLIGVIRTRLGCEYQTMILSIYMTQAGCARGRKTLSIRSVDGPCEKDFGGVDPGFPICYTGVPN